jgi:FkbM family methyltransferase
MARSDFMFGAVVAYALVLTIFIAASFWGEPGHSSASPHQLRAGGDTEGGMARRSASAEGESDLLAMLNDDINVRIPRNRDGTPLSTSERLRLLELKVGGHQNWANDPLFGGRRTSVCKNPSNLKELGCPTGTNEEGRKCSLFYDHYVCLDLLPEPAPPGDTFPYTPGRCLVYDFGIRKNPEFGKAMALQFGCEVHAFDPSPITIAWYPTSDVSKLPNYHFHPYGAGGVDGEVKLNEYDWGQVSLLRFPERKMECDEKECKAKSYASSKSFSLPVKTLKTVMNELGHTHVDLLKVDVEGSEYAFLEEAVDTSALLGVDQLTLEWHHYGYDGRYGMGSSPSINALSTVMSAFGLELFWKFSQNGWESTSASLHNRWPEGDFVYNLGSYMRV